MNIVDSILSTSGIVDRDFLTKINNDDSIFSLTQNRQWCSVWNKVIFLYTQYKNNLSIKESFACLEFKDNLRICHRVFLKNGSTIKIKNESFCIEDSEDYIDIPTNECDYFNIMINGTDYLTYEEFQKVLHIVRGLPKDIEMQLYMYNLTSIKI